MNFVTRKSKKSFFPAIAILSCLTACSSPQYYKHSPKLENSLNCFAWNSSNPLPYARSFARTDVSLGTSGDVANEADNIYGGQPTVPESVHNNDRLLYLAIMRINISFAGEHGIYHNLFKEPFKLYADDGKFLADANTKCGKDDDQGKGQVSISAFSTPTASAVTGQSTESAQGQADGAQPTTAQSIALPVNAKQSNKNPAPLGKKGNNPSSSPDKAHDIQDTDTMLKLETNIVISSYLYSMHPADRLDKVYVLITPIEPGIEFISADKIDVQSQSVDYGQVTNSASLTGSAIPIGATYGQLVSATPSLTQSYQRTLKRQYATQNVEIFPLRNILLISEDGGPAGADLTGNKSVKVAIRVPAGSRLCSYQNVYQFDSTTGALSNPHAICHIDRIPALMGAIAIERKVVSGDETIEEADDEIRLVPSKNLKVFDLWLNPNELYGITQSGEMTGDGNNKPVLFNNYASALSYRSWLEAHPDKFHAISTPTGNINKSTSAKADIKNTTPVVCLYRKKQNYDDPLIQRRRDSEYCL